MHTQNPYHSDIISQTKSEQMSVLGTNGNHGNVSLSLSAVHNSGF